MEVQNYLVNATTNITTVNPTDNLNIVITANQGYEFTNESNLYVNVAGYRISDRYTNFTYSNNNTVASININLKQIYIDDDVPPSDLHYLRFYGTAQAVHVNTPDVIIDRQENCTINAPSEIPVNSILNITATANENYIFETAPYITISGAGISPLQNKFYLTLSNDNKTATISFDFSEHYTESELNDITIIGIFAVAAPEIVYRNYGAINVYKVNDNILNQFAAKRFTDGQQLTPLNLGDNVITIKKYFFNISETVPNNIKCANYDTLINAATPLENIFIFDCGNITILPVQNNALDFENEMQIFLPFYGFANFSNDYINKEINLKYYINIVTAKGEIKLFYNNICVESWQITPCIDVNFKFLNYDNLENNSNDLKGLTPYVLVKRFNGFCSAFNSDNKNVRINTLSRGNFYKFDNITNLNLPYLASKSALETEYNLIIQQLKEGVIL